MPVRQIKILSAITVLSIFGCAPVVCPETDSIKKEYSEWNSPSSYNANLSLRYGLIRIPIQVKKREGKFTISGEDRTAELSFNNLCVGGVCANIPVNPDGVIFGKVLRGDEKVNCSFSGLSFERDEGPYRSKYVFKDGRLTLVEFYDKDKNRWLKLRYLDWAKEGYARAIRIEGDQFNLVLTVDSLKF
ncbi:MAG: hypothetical protein RMI50_02680 [Aquificaceae bacterium]|nr:hypothetical protein [Aquificaceae bacterium]